MKMGVARFASVHPTRDSEATETNDLIELLNATTAVPCSPLRIPRSPIQLPKSAEQIELVGL
jgi:hypothetical protein